MRSHVTWLEVSKPAIRLGALGALSATLVAGVPLAASANTHGADPLARSAAAAGVVYGGRTAQGWPVVIETSKNRRQVVQAVGGLRLTCTSGSFVNLSDRYTKMPVSKSRKFATSFGPETLRNDDGTTSDFEGSISGALNSARSKVTGKWQLKLTERDAAGTVTDTCDSGSVSWTAKQ
jgi:hypothetical protein